MPTGGCSRRRWPAGLPPNPRRRERRPSRPPTLTPSSTSEFPVTLTWTEPTTPPAGSTERFGGRWRLVGAGLSNVWRFGDLELAARSGRLLLRGPNGTGKTTALEALWPYLLDLNSMRLAAGRARN